MKIDRQIGILSILLHGKVEIASYLAGLRDKILHDITRMKKKYERGADNGI